VRINEDRNFLDKFGSEKVSSVPIKNLHPKSLKKVKYKPKKTKNRQKKTKNVGKKFKIGWGSFSLEK